MMLQVQNVSKSYHNQPKPAVSNVSLNLEIGKSLAIVGESGSGKTTLLKIIAGLEDADKGKVFLHQKEVFGSAYTLVPGHKRIKLLQQDFNLMPRHRIWENIAYYLRLRPKDEQEARVTQLLQWFDLQEVAEKYPSELSGGQQQRAALAVALADEPDLLLLDEPFSHLDNRLKLRLRREITQTLQNIGIAFIVVTHDIEDAFYMTEELAIMHNGEILQQNTLQNVFKTPKNSYVAELLGYENIFPFSAIANLLPTEQEKIAKDKLVAIHSKSITLHTKNILTTSENDISQELLQNMGTVQKTVFLGSFYEITVSFGQDNLPLIVHSQNQRNIGEVVAISCIDFGVLCG
jgi:iron(III) transport system ATP-binding protein